MFVERDEAGRVVGVFLLPQPGFAEEELPDDDPEVVGFVEMAERVRNGGPAELPAAD